MFQLATGKIRVFADGMWLALLHAGRRAVPLVLLLLSSVSAFAEDLLFGPLEKLPLFGITIIPEGTQHGVATVMLGYYPQQKSSEFQVVRADGSTTKLPIAMAQMEQFYRLATRAVREFKTNPLLPDEMKFNTMSVSIITIPQGVDLRIFPTTLQVNPALRDLLSGISKLMPNGTELP